MVGLVVNLGRDTGVGDLDRQDAVLVALELGRHAEVLGALNPRVDRGVLRDDRVLVRVVKSHVIVHVILGDGGNGLADGKTHIHTELKVNPLHFIPAHIEVDFIRLGPILERLIGILFCLECAESSHPHLLLAVEFLLVDGEIDMCGEALDLHGVHTIEDSLGNEHEAGGSARELDSELIVSGLDRQGVGVGVELNINETVGDDRLLGVRDNLLAVDNLVLHPGAGLGIRGEPDTVLPVLSVLTVLSVSALGTVVDRILLTIGGGELPATRLS